MLYLTDFLQKKKNHVRVHNIVTSDVFPIAIASLQNSTQRCHAHRILQLSAASPFCVVLEKGVGARNEYELGMSTYRKADPTN